MPQDLPGDLASFSAAVRDAIRRTRAAERTLDQSGVLMWATTLPAAHHAGGENWRTDPIVVLRGGEVDHLSDGVTLGACVEALVGADSGYPKAREKILRGHSTPLAYLEHPRGLAHSSDPWLSRYTPVRDGGGSVIGIACTSMPFVDVELAVGRADRTCPLGTARPCRQSADTSTG